jgi:hypothetical protein
MSELIIERFLDTFLSAAERSFEGKDLWFNSQFVRGEMLCALDLGGMKL